MSANGYCDASSFVDSFSDLCLAGQLRIIIQSLYFPFTALGSILTMTTIRLLKELHTPHDYVLFAIAVVDLIEGVVNGPLYLLKFLPETGTLVGPNKWMCVLTFLFRVTVDNLAFDLLTLMCVDRFLMIWKPIWYKVHMSRRIIIMAVTGILVLRLIYFMVFIGMNVINDIDNAEWSTEHCLKTDYLAQYLEFIVVLRVVACLELPLCCILCILVVFKALQRHRRRAGQENAKYKQDRVNAIFTASVTFVFLVFWLPYFVVFAVLQLNVTSYIVKDIVRMIHFLNSIMNPVVYVITREIYRSSFKFLLTTPPCRWRDLPRWRQRQELIAAVDRNSRKVTTDVNKDVGGVGKGIVHVNTHPSYIAEFGTHVDNGIHDWITPVAPVSEACEKFKSVVKPAEPESNVSDTSQEISQG